MIFGELKVDTTSLDDLCEKAVNNFMEYQAISHGSYTGADAKIKNKNHHNLDAGDKPRGKTHCFVYICNLGFGFLDSFGNKVN